MNMNKNRIQIAIGLIALGIAIPPLFTSCCPKGESLPYPAYLFRKVEFEGHTYIYWNSTSGGLEHDPNCHCFKEAKKEEHIYEQPN